MRVAPLLAALLFLLHATAALAQGRRVALVIGIERYATMSALPNAVADARALRRTLESVGFEVVGSPAETENPDQRGMEEALLRLQSRARGAQLVVFAFFGHGLHLRGRGNLLLPADFPVDRLDAPDLAARRAFREDEVLSLVANAAPEAQRLLIFDASREVVGAAAEGQIVRSRGAITRGLQPAPEVSTGGTLVAYSASHGQVAYDRLSREDPVPNGVFARHLLRHLVEPGVSVLQALERTATSVARDTATAPHGPQTPVIRFGANSKFGDIFFGGRPATRPTPDHQTTAVQTRPWNFPTLTLQARGGFELPFELPREVRIPGAFVAGHSQARGGTVEIRADGTGRYAPRVDFGGEDRVDVDVQDSSGRRVRGTIVFRVTPTPPVRLKQERIVLETVGGVPVNFDLHPFIAAGEQWRLTRWLSTPQNGEIRNASINGTGQYVPRLDFVGEDQWNFEVEDAWQRKSRGTFVVQVRLNEQRCRYERRTTEETIRLEAIGWADGPYRVQDAKDDAKENVRAECWNRRGRVVGEPRAYLGSCSGRGEDRVCTARATLDCVVPRVSTNVICR